MNSDIEGLEVLIKKYSEYEVEIVFCPDLDRFSELIIGRADIRLVPVPKRGKNLAHIFNPAKINRAQGHTIFLFPEGAVYSEFRLPKYNNCETGLVDYRVSLFDELGKTTAKVNESAAQLKPGVYLVFSAGLADSIHPCPKGIGNYGFVVSAEHTSFYSKKVLTGIDEQLIDPSLDEERHLDNQNYEVKAWRRKAMGTSFPGFEVNRLRFALRVCSDLVEYPAEKGEITLVPSSEFMFMELLEPTYPSKLVYGPPLKEIREKNVDLEHARREGIYIFVDRGMAYAWDASRKRLIVNQDTPDSTIRERAIRLSQTL